LEQFGPSDGVEVVNCPYDGDRRFLYFSYCDRIFLTNPNFSLNFHHIESKKVCKDNIVSETSETSDDVYLYPFKDYIKKSYEKKAIVRAESVVFSSRVRDFFNLKYGKFVKKVEKVDGGSDEPGVSYLVTFTDEYPVYRMFHDKTHFGQVVETIPDTSDRLYVTTPHLSKSIWKHNYMRMFNVPPIPNDDVLEFFNEFLDCHDVNPGIVAVSKTTSSYYSKDLKTRLAADPNLLESKETQDAYYELYFANPWHAVDVCHRLAILNRAGAHKFHCTVDMHFYRSIKKFLTTEKS
jgi:hypothetical protein